MQYIVLMNLSVWICGTSFKSLKKPNKNFNNRHERPSWVIGHGCSRDSQNRQPPVFAFGGPSEVQAKFLLKTPCASETGPRDHCTGTDLMSLPWGLIFMRIEGTMQAKAGRQLTVLLIYDIYEAAHNTYK